MITISIPMDSDRTINETTPAEDHPGHQSGLGETNKLTNDTTNHGATGDLAAKEWLWFQVEGQSRICLQQIVLGVRL